MHILMLENPTILVGRAVHFWDCVCSVILSIIT